MHTAEELIKAVNENNKFLKHCGIQITELTNEICRCETIVTPNFLNLSGVAQGGLLFTLADGASGCFSRLFHEKTLTLDSTFQYYSNVGSGKIIGEAKVIQIGGRISRFYCRVIDEKGKLLADGVFTHYKIGD